MKAKRIRTWTLMSLTAGITLACGLSPGIDLPTADDKPSDLSDDGLGVDDNSPSSDDGLGNGTGGALQPWRPPPGAGGAWAGTGGWNAEAGAPGSGGGKSAGGASAAGGTSGANGGQSPGAGGAFSGGGNDTMGGAAGALGLGGEENDGPLLLGAP